MNKKSLDNKILKAKEIIIEAKKKYGKKLAVAWTGGKDSTVLLHIIREIYHNKVPYVVMFNDSTMEFDEIYEFIDKIQKDWKLKLIVIKHLKQDLDLFYQEFDFEKKKKMSRIMKINAINYALKKYKFSGFFAAVRWDEHEARSKETYISPRKDHVRIHPVLHFTEKDIWDYIKLYQVPYVSLYDEGYRSLGEKPFTKPAVLGGNERSGREKDKEKLMKNLRELGYW